MEPLDATVWQLSSSVKVEFLALSGILSHLSGGGLWVWTCKICGDQHHLCSYLCLCVESPGAGRPMSKVCVQEDTLLQTCTLTTDEGWGKLVLYPGNL